jgi:hypothetical protein
MRCPICRADNDQGPQCRRCRADLSLLWTLEAQRERALAAAYQALAAGQAGNLLGNSKHADALRRDEESARLVVLGHLLRRDFPAAWQTYSARFRRSEAPGPSEPTGASILS